MPPTASASRSHRSRCMATRPGSLSRGHEMFIAPGEYVFEAGGVATRLLGNVVSLTWTMVSRRDGETAGGGLDVLALGSDGRIRTDHQFIGA
jgi:hypothetical protein